MNDSELDLAVTDLENPKSQKDAVSKLVAWCEQGRTYAILQKYAHIPDIALELIETGPRSGHAPNNSFANGGEIDNLFSEAIEDDYRWEHRNAGFRLLRALINNGYAEQAAKTPDLLDNAVAALAESSRYIDHERAGYIRQYALVLCDLMDKGQAEAIVSGTWFLEVVPELYRRIKNGSADVSHSALLVEQAIKHGFADQIMQYDILDSAVALFKNETQDKRKSYRGEIVIRALIEAGKGQSIIDHYPEVLPRAVQKFKDKDSDVYFGGYQVLAAFVKHGNVAEVTNALGTFDPAQSACHTFLDTKIRAESAKARPSAPELVTSFRRSVEEVGSETRGFPARAWAWIARHAGFNNGFHS